MAGDTPEIAWLRLPSFQPTTEALSASGRWPSWHLGPVAGPTGRLSERDVFPSLPVGPLTVQAETLLQSHRASNGSLAALKAEALTPLVRTLFRSLQGLPPPLPTGHTPAGGGEAVGDLVAWIARSATAVRRESRGESPGIGALDRTSRTRGFSATIDRAPFSEELPALVAGPSGNRDGAPIRAEPGRARLPGLPDGPVETDAAPLVEVSLGVTSPNMPGGFQDLGPAGPSRGLPGESSGLPGPRYHGVLPLISTGVSAVSAAALASRDRPGERRTPETREATAEQARQEAAQGQASLDLEGLAAEMTQRILRRLKREKERRGFHA